ncbi:MAG: hypothetical protein OXG15_16075 [Gammaproteobacteria bacterium]|nr:hypothetical protein [Gammaproteobacteria bacterium]
MTTYSQEVGRFKFDISYRRMRGDQGLSIRVSGPVANETRELLRFDCFDNRPHYHVEVYGKNEITAIDDNDATEWSLRFLTERFEGLVDSAGADKLNLEERDTLESALSQVSENSRNLVTAERAA